MAILCVVGISGARLVTESDMDVIVNELIKEMSNCESFDPSPIG